MRNHQIADIMEAVAERWTDAADPFRARAYRRAAHTIRTRKASVAERYEQGGVAALQDLPGVGPGIAKTLVELLDTGHVAMLDPRGHARCESAIADVPGIGPVLAHRIHLRAGVHTLEDLEAAAHDGRLAAVPGLGARRAQCVRDFLATHMRRPSPPARPVLPVAELLDVDRDYRDEVDRGTLIRIAPHRFNPEHVAWLPVLRTTRGPRRYVALFSNTERAHALG
jgi:DNA polymerase/3'-5' exonuclease PolX